MPNRRVLELPVLPPVAHAIVLHLDDDAPYLTVGEVEHIFDDGGVSALPAEKRFAVTNVKKFKADSPLLPSGLLGPVTLRVAQE